MLATTWDIFAFSYKTARALEFPGNTVFVDLAYTCFFFIVFPSRVDIMTESLC